jgi:hypothetical protein
MPFKLNTCTRAILYALFGILGAAHAGATPVIGGSTTFIPDPGIESVYDSLNVTESLIPPATGNLQSEPETLMLPITGGDTTTELVHSGGVIISAKGQTVDVTGVVIHFSGADANKVTANLSFHGLNENIVAADISGSNVLTVDPSFAAFIQAAGGPDLTGMRLATFNAQPKLATAEAPEPGQLGLIGVGLLACSAVRMRSKRNQHAA